MDQFDFGADPDEQPAEQETPKALRDAYNRQKQENETLRQQLADLQKVQHETTVNQFIKDKGLPEKVRGLIGQTDPETWYSEYGDMFTANTPEPPKETTAEPAIPPEQVEQIKQVNSVQPGPYVPGSGEELDSKLDAIYSSAKSEEEIFAALAQIDGALSERSAY